MIHDVSVKLEPAALSKDEKLIGIAARLFWWKSRTDALADPVRFAAQVMVLGNWEDVQTARQKLGDELFRATLAQAPPGVFDEPSWVYWHNVFGIAPVPPLPTRNLC